MADDNNSKDKDANGHSAVREIASAVGIVSAVAVLLTAISSWAFARGLVAELGFPGNVVNLRDSIDVFPSMGYEYSGSFLIALVLGFSTRLGHSRSERYQRYLYAIVLFLGAALLVISALWELHSRPFSGLLLVTSFIAPFWIGYFFQAFAARSKLERVRLVMPVVLLALALNVGHLYVFGVSTGIGLANGSLPWPQTERGESAIKPNDFPLVSIVLKEDVPVPCNGNKSVNSHAFGGDGSLRLIISDESNYYLICRTSPGFESFALRKELVHEMSFLKPSPR